MYFACHLSQLHHFCIILLIMVKYVKTVQYGVQYSFFPSISIINKILYKNDVIEINDMQNT